MRKFFFLLFVLILIGHVTSAQNKENEFSFTEADRAVGLSTLWSAVKYNYVYYDQLKFDWDSLYHVSMPKMLSIKDPFEYCRELQRICAMLGDGHTKVFANINRSKDDLIMPAPFVVKLFNKRLYANKVFSSQLTNNGFEHGVELLKINGQNAYEYGLTKVIPFVSSSTPQWLIYDTFNSFELTKGRTGDSFTIQFKDHKGKIVDLRIDKEIKWDSKRPFFDYKNLSQNVGYLKINSFMGNDDFYKQFDTVYEQIKPTNSLIIDVRDNPGGNTGFAYYILQHLTEKSFKSSPWSSRMYIPAHAAWDWDDEWYAVGSSTIPPLQKEIYTKPIVLLINEGTFSTAEDFTIMFKGMNRGKIIGKPTAGSTGNPISITLLKGVAGAIICTKKDIAPDGTIFVGVGIKPDVEADETLEGFLSGNDPIVQKALLLLKNGN